MRFSRTLLPTLAFLLWASGVQAATYCVSNVNDLLQKIATFSTQPDGSTLVVKLVKGNYSIGNGFGDVVRDSGSRAVGFQLLGGYSPGCTSRKVDPANTVLDGLSLPGGGLLLWLLGDADVRIEGITFQHFVASNPYRSVLEIDGIGSSATYAVQYCRLLGNTGSQLVRMAGARMSFANNLVAGNTLSGAVPAALYAQFSYEADSMLSASNNTIADNAGGAGVRVDTWGWSSVRTSEIANNVLWGNGGKDLDLSKFDTSASSVLVSANVVGTSSGPALPSGNLVTNPKFSNAGQGDYTLASGSPAINSGTPIQLYGFPAHDLSGGTRIVGSLIDRGAYESTIDNSTTAVVTTTSDNGSNTSPTPGSLRAAIKAANAATGPFRIQFDVSAGCPTLLSLSAPMLDVSGDVTIDGTTQTGWTANTDYGRFDSTVCLYLNGLGSTPWALHVPSGAPTNARLVVRGLGFAGFSDAAIKLEGGRNHRIWGSQFGSVPLTLPNRNAIRVTGASGGAFIGGYDDPGAVNLVAGSSDAGIFLDNTSGGSTVANAVIGMQPDGIGDGGNAMGIFAFNSPNNVVQYSYVGNSTSNGIVLSGAASSGNVLQYNRIGFAVGGQAVPNAGAGVLVNFAAKNNTIGAPLGADWGSNLIVGSGGPGVWISPSGGAGNRVLDNTFFGNAGLDIDLAAAGPSANQASNPSSGPNGLQNYPVLTSATRDAATKTETVAGTLTSAPNTTYRLDFHYAIGDCSTLPGGRGGAYRTLERTYVTTGALGSVPFTATVAFSWDGLPIGAISATATDPAGNTSEIGNCVAEILSDHLFQDGFE